MVIQCGKARWVYNGVHVHNVLYVVVYTEYHNYHNYSHVVSQAMITPCVELVCLLCVSSPPPVAFDITGDMVN